MGEEKKNEEVAPEVRRGCGESVRNFFKNLAVFCMPAVQRVVDVSEDVVSAYLKEKIQSNGKLTDQQKNILTHVNGNVLKMMEKNLVTGLNDWANEHKEDFEKNKLLASAATAFHNSGIVSEVIKKGDLEEEKSVEFYEHKVSEDHIKTMLPNLLINTTKLLENVVNDTLRKSCDTDICVVNLESLTKYALIPKDKFADIVAKSVNMMPIPQAVKKDLLKSESVKAFLYMILEEHNNKIMESMDMGASDARSDHHLVGDMSETKEEDEVLDTQPDYFVTVLGSSPGPVMVSSEEAQA